MTLPIPDLPGPYDTREQASEDTHDIREVAGVHYGAGREKRRDRMVDACRDAGIELGAYDREVIGWLSEFATDEAVQSIAAMIRRAYAGGRPAGEGA